METLAPIRAHSAFPYLFHPFLRNFSRFRCPLDSMDDVHFKREDPNATIWRLKFFLHLSTVPKETKRWHDALCLVCSPISPFVSTPPLIRPQFDTLHASVQSLSELKRFSLTVEDWQGYGLDVQGAMGKRKNAAEVVQLPDVPLEMVEAAMRDTLAQV